MNKPWHQCPEIILAVGDFGVDESEFITAVQLQRFYEKPWNYDELYARYLTDLDREDIR